MCLLFLKGVEGSSDLLSTRVEVNRTVLYILTRVNILVRTVRGVCQMVLIIKMIVHFCQVSTDTYSLQIASVFVVKMSSNHSEVSFNV